MSAPIRGMPGRKAFEALQRLDWRFQTQKDDFQALMDLKHPEFNPHNRRSQFEQRGELYDAERKLHHYLAGYYTYWRLVMTVGHATEKPECAGRIEAAREEHDERPAARIVRGLRLYVQKENILPLLIYMSDHEEHSPRYALNKDELEIGGRGYDRDFDFYYETIDGPILFPFETIEDNWRAIESLHEEVISLVEEHMEDELDEYEERLEGLRDVRDEIVIPEFRDLLVSDEERSWRR